MNRPFFLVAVLLLLMAAPAWAFNVRPTDPAAPVPVNSAVTSSSIADWPTGYLIDGQVSTIWSSTNHGEHLASAEWAAVILADQTSVTRIRLYPRAGPGGLSLGFPKDFVIQYSYNVGNYTCDSTDSRFTQLTNWLPLVSRFGYPQPGNDWVDFDINPHEMGCLRVLGAELSQDDYGFRYLQLGEIQLYEVENLLSPADVATSSAIPGWPAGYLIDGQTGTVWSSTNHGEHLASAEWAAVILADQTSVTRIRLYPRAGPELSLGFPKDFVIQYSYNGGNYTCDSTDSRFAQLTNWLPLVSRFGYTQPGNAWVEFSFSPQFMGCVRVLGAELSQDDYGFRYLQVSEIQLYEVDNLLSFAAVATSSAIPGWPAGYLIDGQTSTVWSSVNHGEHLASAEWAAVLLAARTTVNRVHIYPRAGPGGLSLGFPKDFVIQYSYTGDNYTCNPGDSRFTELTNWLPLVSRFGYTQPDNQWVELTFNNASMDCLRVLGAELSQDDYGFRYLQLAEIKLYGPFNPYP